MKNCLEFLLQVQTEHHHYRQLCSTSTDLQAGGRAHTPVVARKALSKLGKAINTITLILGVQSLESLAAEAKVVNMCPKDIKAVERDSNSSGLWLAICLLCFFVVILAVAFYFVWKRFNKRLSEQEAVVKQMQQDFFHCWNQVADEDGYIAQQETRINELHNRLMMHDGRLVEQSNEHSMLHDYICGLHYGLVESGGFLRFGFGLTTDQFTSLAMHDCVWSDNVPELNMQKQLTCQFLMVQIPM